MNASQLTSLIDTYYRDSPEARRILQVHSEAVAQLALDINRERELGLDPSKVWSAAMIHDIGIIRTNAPGLHCHGALPYIAHGLAGYRMLKEAGAPDWAMRIALRHTGAGLTRDDIERQRLPLPRNYNYVPHTTLEKLICYADKFFSKRPGQLMTKKSLETVRTEMMRHGGDTLERFDELHGLFGPVETDRR